MLKQPRSILMLVVVTTGALLFLLSLLVENRSSTTSEETPESFVQSKDANLETIAQSVLRAFQLGRLESVHLLLTQQGSSFKNLEDQFVKWSTNPESHDLKQRKIIESDKASGKVIVGIESDSGSGLWTWFFVQEPTGWKLLRTEGGPPIQ